MALTSGTRIGAYEIVGAVGAGGPAYALGNDTGRELRRGLAEAKRVRSR
jgi:hypothetical protein